METLRNGKFSELISGADLASGLRKFATTERNTTNGFEDLTSLIGKEGSLQTLSTLTRIDTSVIDADGFPYPQFFNLKNYMIICGETKIYEYNGSTLTLKGTFTAGSTWKVLDYFDFIYLSNTKVVVKRDSQSGVYSATTDYPTANAACNYNGQALLGAPDVEVS